MMGKMAFYCGLYLIGVFISAVANVMLKKSATQKAEVNIFTLADKLAPTISNRVRSSKSPIWLAVKKHKALLIEYLNPFTVLSYVIFFTATLLTVFSYKVVPLTMAPILGASEYFFVAILSKIFVKETIGWRKIVGLGIIVVGVLVYSL